MTQRGSDAAAEKNQKNRKHDDLAIRGPAGRVPKGLLIRFLLRPHKGRQAADQALILSPAAFIFLRPVRE